MWSSPPLPFFSEDRDGDARAAWSFVEMSCESASDELSHMGAEKWTLLPFVILVGITLYRKELSCNRVYQNQRSSFSVAERVLEHFRFTSHTILARKLQSLAATVQDIGWRSEMTTATPGEKTSEEELTALHQEGVSEIEQAWGPVPVPQDISLRVASFLTAQDLFSLASVSRRNRQIADHDATWENVWLSRFDKVWSSPIVAAAARRWDVPVDTGVRPSPRGRTWKVFYSEFEAEWIRWTVAGCNFDHHCLLGIHGAVYDLSSFIHSHPGSPDTLLEHAGCDATIYFEDIGHSADARRLLPSFLVAEPKGGRVRCILQSVRLSLDARKRSLLLDDANVEWGSCSCDASSHQMGQHPDSTMPTRNAQICSHSAGTQRPVYNPILGKWACVWSCCGMFAFVSQCEEAEFARM
jgi:hypothetical protein